MQDVQIYMYVYGNSVSFDDVIWLRFNLPTITIIVPIHPPLLQAKYILFIRRTRHHHYTQIINILCDVADFHASLYIRAERLIFFNFTIIPTQSLDPQPSTPAPLSVCCFCASPKQSVIYEDSSVQFAVVDDDDNDRLQLGLA